MFRLLDRYLVRQILLPFLLVLVGLQLVVSWVVLQVLDALNHRETQVEEKT